jgi:aminoglycoside 6-adenylyltransferase
MQQRVREFLDQVAGWAGGRADVHGVVLLGSQARADTPADEVSDVDLVVFVDDPERYLGDTDWLREFGEPLLTFREPTAVGEFEERRVLFQDGLEVDFSILPNAVGKAPPRDVDPVLARGFQVLYDNGLGLSARPRPTFEPPIPTQADLDQLSNDFWYHVLWAAKKLSRGELLLAKQACDGGLTWLLVRLARWRAHGRDTWHGLRFFEQWAGEDVVQALGPTFARYEAQDVARALRTKAELFAKVEDDVAERFGLALSVDRTEVLRRLEVLHL